MIRRPFPHLHGSTSVPAAGDGTRTRIPRPAPRSGAIGLRDDACHRTEFAQGPAGEWYTEWWYFNLNDAETGLAFFLSYLMPPGNTSLGATLVGAFGDGGEPFQVVTPGPVTVSAETADVAIGANRIEVQGESSYRVHGEIAQSGGVRWDLTFERDGPPPSYLIDGFAGRWDWEVGYWLAFMPRARASGTIEIRGRQYRITGAAAYHDHNWGAWCSIQDTWAWLEISEPTRQFSLDAGFSASVSPSRMALLSLGDTTYQFGEDGMMDPQFTEWKGTTWQYPAAGSVTMLDTSGRIKVELAWSIEEVIAFPATVLFFEQHGRATARVFERATEAPGGWRPVLELEAPCFAEWADAYLPGSEFGSPMQGAYRGEVTVFGGGVAGLTAAHELAERGFAVTVVEKCEALDARGERAMALGGMARSQYARVPAPAGDDAAFPAGRPTPDPEEDTWTDLRWTCGNGAVLDEAARGQLRAAAELFLERYAGRGYTLRVSAHGLANAAVEMLAEAGVPRQRVHVDESHGAPAGEAVLTLKLCAHILPGEHGFRFFPSYYRHVFDTMRRIPVYGADGEMTARRVLDNLVSTPVQLMVKRGIRPYFSPRVKVTPVQGARLASQTLRELAYDFRDGLQFGLRLLRYQMTSPERRAGYENLTWWEYVRGWNPRTRCYKYRYSRAFSQDTTFSGRVLAAFDWRCGDARTNGSTLVQLMNPEAGDPAHIDGTLNGPTSEAWFVHWRRYLEERGVRFVPGELERLELRPAAGQPVVVPWVRIATDAPAQPWPRRSFLPRYFVVATDAVAAEAASAGLPAVGVPRGLRGYTTVYQDPRSPAPTIVRRDPCAQPGLGPYDRYQTLSGIQYFFRQNFTLVGGHVYSLDAPWGLSSVNLQQFWGRIPMLARDGFAGVCSVDIGDWSRMAYLGTAVQSAWNSSRQEIGNEIWRQLSADFFTGTDSGYPVRFPRPAWFHLDDNLRFGERDGRQDVPIRNLSPYLVPIVGDWERRPGPAPFDPNIGAAALPPPEEGVWYARHGGYPVHWGSLVYAGIYLKTFTRMTTMESANESARHAVNALLDHCNARHTPAPIPAGPVPAPPPAARDAMEASRTPLEFTGDYCGIWNIERYESTGFDKWKAVDRFLLKLGLPHLFDLLLVELIPALLSHLFPYRGDLIHEREDEDEGVPEQPAAWWCLPFFGSGGKNKKKN